MTFQGERADLGSGRGCEFGSEAPPPWKLPSWTPRVAGAPPRRSPGPRTPVLTEGGETRECPLAPFKPLTGCLVGDRQGRLNFLKFRRCVLYEKGRRPRPPVTPTLQCFSVNKTLVLHLYNNHPCIMKTLLHFGSNKKQ